MRMNIIFVFNSNEDKLLMCLRSKDPYKGLYNLVGGKIEEGEDGFTSAYRELEEESGITRDDINLMHFMDLIYYAFDMELEVYVGTLNKEVSVVEEVNKLYWIDMSENFFDMTKYAGEGNIGHILEEIKCHKNKAS